MRFAERFMESHNNRVFGLDIVRAAAILIVVYGHGVYFFPEKYHSYYYLLTPLIDGVSIFFVLSGFLIGGILLKIIQNGAFTSTDLINFWLRRWFRTLPNYFFVLAGLVIYQLFFYKNLGGVNFKYILFLQNFVSPHPPIFPEAWSLCVEEWFYLLFPIACFVFYKILKNKSKSVLISAILFILPPLLFRVFYYYNGINADNWESNIRKVLVFRIDSLMYGIIGAYFYNFKKELWLKYKKICLYVSGGILLYLSIYWRLKPSLAFLAVYQYNLESVATLLSLPFLSELKSIKNKSLTFIITFISIISYSMYVLNYSVVQCRLIPLTLSSIGLGGISNRYTLVFTYFMYWFYILVGSYFLYKYYEKPMMDLRNRITITEGNLYVKKYLRRIIKRIIAIGLPDYAENQRIVAKEIEENKAAIAEIARQNADSRQAIVEYIEKLNADTYQAVAGYSEKLNADTYQAVVAYSEKMNTDVYQIVVAYAEKLNADTYRAIAESAEKLNADSCKAINELAEKVKELPATMWNLISDHTHLSGKFFPYKSQSSFYDVPKQLNHMADLGDPVKLPIPPKHLWEGYAETAEGYLETGRVHVARMMEILAEDNFQIQDNFRAMELGCAAARMLRWLAGKAVNGEFWGVDICAEHIIWCQQNLSPPFHFFTTTTEPHLPFSDEYFDFIYAGSVFSHISELADFWFLELRRVLKKGGRLYVTIHDRNTIDRLFETNPTFFLAEELSKVDKETRILSTEFDMFAFAMFSNDEKRNSKGAMVFYDINYLKKKLQDVYQIKLVTLEAYGLQTSLLLEK